MEKIFKAGVVQFDIINGQIDLNMEAVWKNLESLATRNVRLAVLPELFSCGFDNLNLKVLSQTTGPILDQLSGFARTHGMAIVGSLPEQDNSTIFNTQYFIDSDGSIKGKYRKLHLFPLTGEHLYYGAGDEIKTLDTSFGRVGLMICYDLRFPELARALFLADARMILVSAQWPDPRKLHWHHLIRARAIENQAFLVCANRTGKDKDLLFPGMSMVVDPMGEVVAQAGPGDQTAVATIDMERVTLARQLIPCMIDRRSDVY